MTETELKPCAHCGCDLIGGPRDNTDNAGEFSYAHPENGCIMGKIVVWPHNSAAWNTRTQPKIKPLVWVRSETSDGWDGDHHTVPTGYTVRGIGNESYRLSFHGGFGVFNSPKIAMQEAQEHYERRILSAIDT